MVVRFFAGRQDESRGRAPKIHPDRRKGSSVRGIGPDGANFLFGMVGMGYASFFAAHSIVEQEPLRGSVGV